MTIEHDRLKREVSKVTVGRAAASVKSVGASATGPAILSAPRGKRTLSHRQIEKAVQSIFEERYGANG